MDIELEAIRRALLEIESLHLQNAVILTDSKSALQALKRWENPNKTQSLLLNLSHLAIDLQWIPAHCGIEGNEIADNLAKLASLMGPKHQPNLSADEIEREIKGSFIMQWTEE